MSNTSSKRGEAHLNLSNAFIKDFPVGSVLTLKMLDDWGFAHHEYGNVNPNSADELNTARNNMRKRINNGGTAVSRDYVDCFTVEVHVFGQSYKVVSADDQFAIAVRDLPHQIRRNFTTRETSIRRLVESEDYSVLPVMDQLRIEMLDSQLREAATSIAHTMARFDREWRKARTAIEKLAGEGRNGGIAGFLEHNDDDDEVEDTP